MEQLRTLYTIVEYKMMQANTEMKEAKKLADGYSEEGKEKDAEFWENARGKALAKWSAYNDVYEAIELYLNQNNF